MLKWWKILSKGARLEHGSVVGLSLILVSGIVAQWTAWRFKLPSILLLLLSGILLGPIFQLVDPDLIFGHLLFPIVSLSVAIILFEGGLVLHFSDLKNVRSVVGRLITIGALANWVVTSLAAYFILGVGFEISVLLGAVLVVTGPTVILPMLRHVRLNAQLSSILRWECVSIDVVGALLAVLSYEVLFANSIGDAIGIMFINISMTVVSGMFLGILAAGALIKMIRYHWIPDYLQETATLMLVVAVYNVANVIQVESGLLAVMVMGIVLANQKKVEVVHIMTFKENLTLILLSTLFVFLAARLPLNAILEFMTVEMLLFLLIIIFIGRPFSVMISTIGSSLTFKNKLYLSWMAPRGIVAAAVSSLFSLKLADAGFQEANDLVLVTFVVIIVTVALYGLTARFVANALAVQRFVYRGVLIVGAHEFARMVARILSEYGFTVLLVDTNRQFVSAAQHDGLHVINGSIMSKQVQEEIEGYAIGKMLAMTPNDEINLLSSIEYSQFFSQGHVYRLSIGNRAELGDHYVSKIREGRILFGNGVTYSYLMKRIASGSEVRTIHVDDSHSISEYLSQNEQSIPLFIITDGGRLMVYTEGAKLSSATAKALIVLE